MSRAVAQWMPHFREAGELHGLCPYLLAAMCSRESGGGVFLTPRGPEGTGDRGHGRGLMQIDDRSHQAFLVRRLPDGRPAWQDARENILYGASLLAEYRKALGGELPAAVAAYNCGVERIRRVRALLAPDALPEVRLKAFDGCTTGRDYASDVLARWASFRGIERELLLRPVNVA